LEECRARESALSMKLEASEKQVMESERRGKDAREAVRLLAEEKGRMEEDLKSLARGKSSESHQLGDEAKLRVDIMERLRHSESARDSARRECEGLRRERALLREEIERLKHDVGRLVPSGKPPATTILCPSCGAGYEDVWGVGGGDEGGGGGGGLTPRTRRMRIKELQVQYMKEELVSAPTVKQVDSLRMRNTQLARKLTSARKQLLAIGSNPSSRPRSPLTDGSEPEDCWHVHNAADRDGGGGRLQGGVRGVLSDGVWSEGRITPLSGAADSSLSERIAFQDEELAHKEEEVLRLQRALGERAEAMDSMAEELERGSERVKVLEQSVREGAASLLRLKEESARAVIQRDEIIAELSERVRGGG
jgi:hypothetical protein